MTRLFIDLETYSETPINHGTYRYAANAEIMLFAWALDEQPAQVWDLTTGEPMPFDLESALLDPAVVVYAHNSMFDRTVMRYAMPDLCPPIERWRDTMVQALCHSLPGALGDLCRVLGVPADKAKDKDGKRLIQLFCKPRPKTSKVLRATRDTHPADWAKFVAYAGDDIEAMREVERRLPKWTYPNSHELGMWHLDQHINDRGLAVDLDLAVAALQAVEDEKVVLAERTAGMTNGELASTTQRDAMLEYMLAEYGVQLPDMQGATLERRLDDPDIPEAMKDLLRIRLQASTTSTSKYKSLVRATNLDGRLRGLLQFGGASRTLRWCIAEGALVTTLERDGRRTQTPIEQVRQDQLVWDGIEWVQHEGVEFSGIKDVIEHDGVRATREHVVYLSDTESTTLGDAADNGLALWEGDTCSTSTN